MLRMISGYWGLQKDPWGFASAKSRWDDSEAAVALSVLLDRAGPLISTQGYINDVSTVATIHHTEQTRDASSPDELSTSPAQSLHRENPSAGVFTYVYVCKFLKDWTRASVTKGPQT